jgi:hypothetical protein
MERKGKSFVPAAAEGFLAFMCCIYAVAVVKAVGLAAVPGDAQARITGALAHHAAGAASVASASLVLTLLYAARLRPRMPYTSAVLDVGASLASTLSPRPLPAATLGLLALHGLQGAVLLLLTARAQGGEGLRGSLTRLSACGDATQLAWAPLFEELTFRVIIFSLVLQRAGGDLSAAVLIVASLFAAIHLPNALGSGGAALAYVGLQVGSAAAVGLYLTAAFAASGSLLEVLLLHVANNVVAVAWQGWEAEAAGGCAALPHASLSLAVASAATAAVYAAAGAATWRALAARTAVGGEGGEGADGGAPTFRRNHPIVYGWGEAKDD